MIAKLLFEAHQLLFSAVNEFQGHIDGSLCAISMEQRVYNRIGDLNKALGIIKSLHAMVDDVES